MRVILFCLLAWGLMPATLRAQDRSTKGMRGTTAAPFNLDRLTGGKMSGEALRGKPTVLVVGLTRKAAPLCRDWATAVGKRFASRIHLYTVVVADNPWYIPRATVRSMLRDFVPAEARHLILIDWGKQFAIDYAIEKDDIPTLFLLDQNGMIVWRHKGIYDPAGAEGLAEILRAIAG